MARGLLSAVGGAMAGLGTGLAQQAEQDGKAKREERLAELQHQNRMQEQGAQNDFTAKRDATLNQFQTQRDTRQNEFQTQRDEAQHGYRIGEIGAQGAVSQANTRLSNDLQSQREDRGRTWERERLGIIDRQQTDREGRWEPETDPATGQRYLRNSRTGDVKAFPRAETQFGGSADAKDVWKLTVDAYTTKKPGGQEETNWLGVYKDLADRPALQGRAYNLAKEQAQQQATKEAGARSGWTGKGYDGMTPEEWIAKRVDDLAPPPRRSAVAPPGAQPASSAPSPAAPAAPPSGKASPPKGPPKAGDVVGGYRFRGGNPSDPKSWEEASDE